MDFGAGIDNDISVRKNVFLTLILCFFYSFFFNAIGQTGPGGVGDNATNKLWLKAGDIAQADGTAVSSWPDASGNGFAFTQGTGTKQPTYKTGILNGQAVVRYDGGDALASTTITSTAGDHTVFGIAHSSTATYMFDNTDGGRWIAGIHGSGAYWDGSWHGTAISTGGTTELLTWVLDDAGAEVFKNGTSYTTGTWDATSRMGGTQVLGARQDQSTQMMTGDIAEWIVYEGALNTAQRTIIENYLAAKYGLIISNDKYAHQGTHLHDVAGIGFEDGSNFHTAAQSGGVLKVTNSSLLNVAGDYLLFGHDSASMLTWGSADVPSNISNIERIDREWRVDISGVGGAVSLELDVASLPALSANYGTYFILFDADGTFSTGAEFYPLTFSGGKWSATSITINDNDFITIAAVHNACIASGSLSSTSTWASGTVPSSGEDLIITGGHTVTIDGNYSTDALNLLDGKVELSGGDLTITNTGVITGVTSNNYVIATSNSLKKEWNAIGVFEYPVGDASNYTPFTLTFNAGTGFTAADVSVSVADAIHPDQQKADHITRYWTATPSGITTPDYNVSMIYTDGDIVGTEANMKMRKYSAGTWTDFDNVDAASNTLSGSNITTFSDYDGGGGAPLPVELLSFEVVRSQAGVLLNWSVAVEINTSRYEIQKSIDGETFSAIGTVSAIDKSSFTKVYQFVDTENSSEQAFYRIRMIDEDESSSFSPIRLLRNGESSFEFNVFPNPLLPQGQLYVEIESDSKKEILLILLDPLGRQVFSKMQVIEEGGTTVALDLQNRLTPGIYIVVGSSNQLLYRKKLLVK